MKTRHASTKTAFTLVELLVVISIIGILAGLLIPGLTVTRSKAQSMLCLSHLKQLQTAFQVYTDDHEQTMPLIAEGVKDGVWQGVEGSWVLGNPRVDVGDENIRNGTLFDYTGRSPKIYHCPADQSTVEDHPEQNRSRSYSILITLNGQISGGNVSKDNFQGQELKAVRPSELFAFIGVSEETIDTSGFWFNQYDPTNHRSAYGWQWHHLPSERHHHGGNLSFLDGHAENHPWNYFPKKQVSWSYTPIVDEWDQKDAEWLMERTSWYDYWLDNVNGRAF